MRALSTSRALRVLHITASSEQGGGPEHVWQLVRHLPAEITSYIAAPDAAPYRERFVASVGEERCFVIPQRKWSFSAFFSLLRWARKNRIAIVHSHGKGAGLYGRLLALASGILSVHSFHGIHLPKNFLAQAVYLALERTLGRCTCVSIATSQSEAATATDLSLVKSRLVIIPNGVMVQTEAELSALRSPFAIVYMGRLEAIKNSLALVPIACALRDLGMLPGCRFLLTGDGVEKEALEAALAHENLLEHFSFVGFQGDVSLFLAGAGCLLSTSLAEGMPLAVLEAQAEGIPVVVSHVRGNIDAVVPGVTGFTYPLHDPAEAARCIARLVEDPALRLRMGHAAREQIATRHDVRSMAMGVARCYTACVAGE